jgi:hypothetical protein
MQRILTLAIVAGLLAGIVPATCFGKESCRGTASCCCAHPATGAPAVAAARAAAPASPATLARGCACPTEMRDAPSDRAPSTLPGAPLPAPAPSVTTPPGHADPLPAAHAAGQPAPLAEPPPLPASVQHHSILRL